MFIKLNLGIDNAFKVFRVEDIISIDPILGVDNTVLRYELILSKHEDAIAIAITYEQAHELALLLRTHTIWHPCQYM